MLNYVVSAIPGQFRW